MAGASKLAAASVRTGEQDDLCPSLHARSPTSAQVGRARWYRGISRRASRHEL